MKSRAEKLCNKIHEMDLDKNSKELLLEFLGTLNETNFSFMLCKLKQILGGVVGQVARLSQTASNVSEAQVFHTRAKDLQEKFEDFIKEVIWWAVWEVF